MNTVKEIFDAIEKPVYFDRGGHDDTACTIGFRDGVRMCFEYMTGDQGISVSGEYPLTLKEFMELPMKVRRFILAQQAAMLAMNDYPEEKDEYDWQDPNQNPYLLSESESERLQQAQQ